MLDESIFHIRGFGSILSVLFYFWWKTLLANLLNPDQTPLWRLIWVYTVCLWPFYEFTGGWSGGAMVLGKLPVPGRPTILITVGQGPIALAVGAGGGGLDIFTLIYPFSSFSLSLGDDPIYTEILSQRAVKPKTTNQPTNEFTDRTGVKWCICLCFENNRKH